LTLRLASVPDFQINNSAAVTAGHMIMKKTKLGVKYDENIESVLNYLIELMKPQESE
jgi:hypothetical protein